MFILYGLINLLPSTFIPVFTPRLNVLLLFLIKNKGLTEEQACIEHLGSIQRKKYFNKMKNQLQSQLSHYLLVWPSSPDNRHKTLHEECYKEFASYKKLLMNGKRKIAIEIAKNLIPKLEKMEFHSMLQMVAQDLVFHYSCISTSGRYSKKYKELSKKQQEIVQAEITIRKYHSRVGFLCNTRDSFTPAIIEEIQEATKMVRPFLQLGSNHLNRLIYSIIVSNYSVIYDHRNIVNYCNQAIASFPDNHPNIHSLRFTFMQNKTLALAAMGNLVEAKATAKEAGKIVPLGSFNWHTVLLKRLIICFHAGDYQEAYELYKAHKQQKIPDKNINDYWKIIHGYLNFLIKTGKIKPYQTERFNLGKFLNEVPTHSKDKAGQNINILIVQILTWMQRGQFGRVIDRIESLKEYARAYTRKPATRRANIFINMIVKMESSQFHLSRTKFKSQALYHKLKNHPIKLGQNMATEMIPYPILWEEIMSMLRDQPRARTVRKIAVQ